MTDTTDSGERIAKVMARAGVASRRDAERLIVEGRVAVNGTVVTSPALDVRPSDRVTLDGKPIDAPQPARLWLYYKPLGLVTSERDEKGRQNVFESLPDGMPRVMSVGRLDMNSEGLLLLTNDGELKRKLELPSTGWLRKYRVRVNGRPNDATFDPLRRGITIEGEDFQPMEVTLDRQQGANAWLTVGLREGRNREVRRAMAEVGLVVNRLIRVSYGPFRLNVMKPGDVVEVKQKVLREQLGEAGGSGEAPRKRREGGADRRPNSRPDSRSDRGADRRPEGRTRDGASFGERRAPRPAGQDRRPPSGDRPPRADRPYTDRDDRPGRSAPRAEATGSDGAERPRKPRHGKDGGPPRQARPQGAARPDSRFGADGDGAERPRKPRHGKDGGPPRASDRPRGDSFKSAGPYRDRRSDERGERPSRPPRPEGDRPKPSRPRDAGERSFRDRAPPRPESGEGPAGERRGSGAAGGDRPRAFAPKGKGGKPGSGGARPSGPKGKGPSGGHSGRPAGPRPPKGRPPRG